MKILASILIFALMAAPGIRLLRLARQTRQTPEFWGGLYFMGAAVGLSLRILGVSIQFDDPELSTLLNTIGHVGLASGTAAMAIFTQRVFHPASRSALLLMVGLVSAIALSTLHTLLGGYVTAENSLSVIVANSMRVLPTAWASIESFRYWRSMTKREALGLSDPVVTNRFLLWVLWSAGVTLMPVIALSLRVATRFVLGDTPVQAEDAAPYQTIIMPLLRLSFLGISLVSVTALSLSFFPPKRYLDRVRQKAQASSATA